MQRVPMRPPVEASRRWPAATAVAGGGTAAIGGAGLVGWATGIVLGQHPPLGPLTPEGAAGLVAAGVALLLLSGAPGDTRRRIGIGFGFGAAAIGVLGLLDRLAGRTEPLLHLRDLLGSDAAQTPTLTPAAATALLLVGLALVTLDLPLHPSLTWSQTLAPAAGAIATVTLLAYLLHATGATPGLAGLTAMPLVTAVGVLALTAGVLLARPDRGLRRPFGSSGQGGALARRAAPVLVLLPFGIVVLSVTVIRVGHSRPALAFALSTAMAVIVLLLLLGRTVRAADEAEALRGRALDELAAERDFTATLLQSLSEAVVVFDRDLRVIDVNSRACLLMGRTRDELIGRRHPYPWQPDGEPLPSLVGEGGDFPGDAEVRRPDGARVPVLARMSPVLDPVGRPRAFVSTFVDVTGHHRSAQALAERAADLELANERLRAGNQRLAEAATFKQDLMSLMSHEVSQPLSSVSSLAELLASDWAELPDDVRLELAEKIHKNTRRLTSMINDMLLLFRLDAGSVTAHRVSVPVSEVIETVAQSATAVAGIATSGDPNLCALVDRGHLWQALSNLLDNALTYGSPPIEIEVRAAPEGVLVSVRDHGDGIPPEQVPHLFDRIARRSGDRAAKGTGVGLFLVRQLMEVNSGAVCYERAEPQGARVTIRLEPAATPADIKPPEPAGRLGS